jgi:hypothetical protein
VTEIIRTPGGLLRRAVMMPVGRRLAETRRTRGRVPVVSTETRISEAPSAMAGHSGAPWSLVPVDQLEPAMR